MAHALYLSGINLAGSIQYQHHFSEGFWWGGLEANQAVIRMADGIASLLAGAGLARGFWGNWKQTWLRIFLIKHVLEFLGQMKLLIAACGAC